MASGILVTFAHNSGGSKADIAVPLFGRRQTGFLDPMVEEYGSSYAYECRRSDGDEVMAGERSIQAIFRRSIRYIIQGYTTVVWFDRETRLSS